MMNSLATIAFVSSRIKDIIHLKFGFVPVIVCHVCHVVVLLVDHSDFQNRSMNVSIEVHRVPHT